MYVLVQFPSENRSVSGGSAHLLSHCVLEHTSGYCLVIDSKPGGTKTNRSEIGELRAWWEAGVTEDDEWGRKKKKENIIQIPGPALTQGRDFDLFCGWKGQTETSAPGCGVGRRR